MTTTITSERVQVTFGEDLLEDVSIVHLPTGREVCAKGRQVFYLRFPNRCSDPFFLRRLESVEAAANAVTFTVTDETGAYRAACTIEATGTGLRFRLEATAPEPIWMAEWELHGLDLEEVIVPALGGQVLTRDMPEEARISYKYPFWWSAQFAVASMGEGAGGLWLRTMEEAPRFKVLRVRRVEEQPHLFVLGLGLEADAPLTGSLSGAWFVDGYAGAWQEPVDAHRAWLESAFDLVPYREHPHFPAWAGDITFVLEFWGMRRDLGRPAHTFADMVERIEAFARLHPPEQTLLYLPGYAEEGIDSNAPDYDPSPKLGGREGFRRLVRRAHDLGYRVMIHTNVLALTFSHPRYEQLKQYQVVDVFGRPQGWGLDMDGDWLAEPYFAYVNPAAEAWGDLMEEVLGELITEFELDAVFLDQTLLAFNVSNGPNFVEGMRRHIERLQDAFPDVLFAGEGLHEQVLAPLPVAQIHGLDSIRDVHGVEGRQPWRQVHPVSVYLFGKYTKYVPHLLTQHPSGSEFERQEAAYAGLGILPTLVCYRASQPIDGPEVQAMLARARALHADKT